MSANKKMELEEPEEGLIGESEIVSACEVEIVEPKIPGSPKPEEHLTSAPVPTPDEDENDIAEILGEDADVIREQDNFITPQQDADAEFFERFSSIRIQYDNSERKTIQEFQFQPEDTVDGNFAYQIWPTLGGWNIDDLYAEVLFCVHHTLRTEPKQPEADGLISHLQQVFHIDNDKHEKILRMTQEKEAPPLVLNVEVAEAKGLHGKDVNGLSDPFCTLFINGRHKHNTSMKPETLTPVWREYFSFPVSSIEDDVFNLEIWDYDPEESVKDKMKRFGEVKSTKGLRVLMKEIVLTSSSTKQQNEFMGCMKIPIKRLPAAGLDRWFPLEGRDPAKNGNGKKNKGEILLRMALGTEKDKKVASQEYRHVFHLLLVHELDEQNVPPHQWSGQFANKHSEFVLRQLQWQGGLTAKELDMAKWLVLARVQCDHPLNPNIFPGLFQQVLEYLEKQLISEDLVRKFWFTTEKLVENYATFVRNVHEFFLNNSNVTAHIYYKLKLMALVRDYVISHPPKQGANADPELKLTEESIVEKIENAISRGAHEMFTSIAKRDPNSADTPVEHMIKIGQLLIADLRIGLETSHSSFKELLGIDYFEITYRVYDEKFGEIVAPVIQDVCSNLKHLDFREDDGPSVEQDLSMGTTLFELYLAVRQFSDLSCNLSSQKDLSISGTFHNWFYASVAQWLDIAFYKAMNRIRKAVQLDNLCPVDRYVQRSSSAVDTAHIFHQIQVFWNQLAWPEVEGSYTFIAKILDDLCRCIICYGEIMCQKVEQLEREKIRGDKYEISDELCSAVNNIEYVGQEMNPICDKLETSKILAELSKLKGENIGSQCKRTLETVMENANENINHKVYEILEQVGHKIKPALERLLKECAEAANEEEGVEKLMKYLDDNLIKLKNRTSQVGFEKIFLIIWENASVALHDLVRINIEKKRPPSFFKQIQNMLNILLTFFYPDEAAAAEIMRDESIKELFDLLELRGASTPDLILKYQMQRYAYQTSLPSKPGEFGMVTIRTHYCEDIRTLRIEVLNARSLKATDSNGTSDPFVKIRIVPEEMYSSTPKLKTKTKKKTLFPLFDETFSIVLNAEEMSRAGLIQFSLKDHDIFGRNDFLGESFLPLECIPFSTSNIPLKDLPQKNLVLHKPTEFNSEILLNLECRSSDKVAQDFVKKEKNKIVPIITE